MTTNPGNPATLSHPSSHLPSPSLFPPPRDYTDSLLPPSPVYPPPQSAAASHPPMYPRATRIRVSVFLRVYPLRIVRTPTTLPPECKNDVCVASAERARSTLQTAARFIHLLHILLPGCCTPAQPSLAEGGRCTQPCATPGRMCVLEERDLRCLPAPRPDGNIERIAPRLIGVEKKKKKKKEEKERGGGKKEEEEYASKIERDRDRSSWVRGGGEVENERCCYAKVVDRGRLLTLCRAPFFFRASIVSLLCFSGVETRDARDN